jgi:hypothetical protein
MPEGVSAWPDAAGARPGLRAAWLTRRAFACATAALTGSKMLIHKI